jgi:hypothetical protein
MGTGWTLQRRPSAGQQTSMADYGDQIGFNYSGVRGFLQGLHLQALRSFIISPPVSFKTHDRV